MKPSLQLLLTALLVAGGLFAYDASRTLPTGPGTGAVEPEAREPAAAREEARSPFPVLEGRGEERWRAEVDRRLADLEARAPSTADVVEGRDGEHAGHAAADEGPAPSDIESGAPGPGGDEPADRRPIEREELQRFRVMLEAVERQRRWEQAAAEVGRFLDRTGAVLTPDQRRLVIRTTLEYQGRWRRIARRPADDDEAKRERREAYAALFAEFEDAVRDLVPRAEADLIMSAIRAAAAGDGDAGGSSR